MALSPRLELRQGQALVMTPQLQQAIKLLQLSNLELAAYVEAELEKNPLLEAAPDDDARGQSEGDAPAGPDSAEDGSGDSGDDDPTVRETDIAVTSESDPVTSNDLDVSDDSLYADRSRAEQADVPDAAGPQDWSSVGAGGASNFEGGDRDFDSFASQELNLRDHLLEQLHVATTDATNRLIGAHLIDQVDEAGYFRGAVDEVADRLGTTADQVRAVLEQCQSFEPTGVMARSLAECLALQLREKNRLDPAMDKLLANLELLARHDFQALMRVCELDADDIAEMIGEIRALNPKPGLKFGGEAIQPVVPDVTVREAADGGWRVDLNSETLPRVLVNSQYYAEVSGKATDSDSKTYLTECFANANWLVKSLDQRARTILKVATEIVKQQDAFLVKGVKHLRPLNLKTVADAIEMHESTVSRVTSNKYMATPRGIFELKYFFTSAIPATGDGEAHSAEAVRHRIKALVDGEDPNDILSDDAIVACLKSDGIDIARRTVAKYRDALKIPSSVQRRRLKKASA
jgi:RNA polymerase sigma-54 factor